ncbi:MAG: N-acetylmuramoyl-L-alanine amidase [Cetobacterium sp.]
MYINESKLEWNGSLKGGNNPSKIVIHNADSKNCTVYDVHRWHIANGWTGIGYHYFVRKDGSIWRGRPEWAVGAHCPTANTNSIGICLEGAFMVEEPTQAQLKALGELVGDIDKRYGRMAIYGHKELYSTDCPGKYFPLQNVKNRNFTGGIIDTSKPPIPPTEKPNNDKIPVGCYGNVIKVSSFLNVRISPNGEVIGKVFPDEEVFVFSEENGWYYIEYDITGGTKKGYVSKDYIKLAESIKIATVTANNYLNVRDTPNGNIIGKVFEGEKVRIKWTEIGWHYIVYCVIGGRKEGYVSANYIKE